MARRENYSWGEEEHVEHITSKKKKKQRVREPDKREEEVKKKSETWLYASCNPVQPQADLQDTFSTTKQGNREIENEKEEKNYTTSHQAAIFPQKQKAGFDSRRCDVRKDWGLTKSNTSLFFSIIIVVLFPLLSELLGIALVEQQPVTKRRRTHNLLQ